MTEIVSTNNNQLNTIIMSTQSSPDTSPQHPWPMGKFHNCRESSKNDNFHNVFFFLF